MAKVRVANATWEYCTADGLYRRAFFGDVVDLPPGELARGRTLGIIVDLEVPAATPEPVAAPVIPGPAPVVDPVPGPPHQAAPAGPEPVRPKSASSTETWRAYAVAKGIPADKAAHMSKVEIREATR